MDNKNPFLEDQKNSAQEELSMYKALSDDVKIPSSSFYQEEKQEPRKHLDKPFKKFLALTLIVSIVGGSFIGIGFGAAKSLMDRNFGYSIDKRQAEQSAIMQTNSMKKLSTSSSSPIVNIVENVGTSVVAITSKVKVQDFFSNEYIKEGQGSGVIFDVNEKNVLVLTNNHVVEKSNNLMVTINQEKQVPAQIVGTDQDTDLAVIKINKSDIPSDIFSKLKPAKFGDSDSLKAGETAIAIGNPLGYNNTVTVGVISAVGRQIDLPDKNLKVIQTDAAINPGNSGGALVNSKGEVIGINTIKVSETSVEGIGFAIPTNYIKPILNDLVSKGFVDRPYLGIVGKNIDQSVSELYEIPIGVIVLEVDPNGSAKSAGIKRGDIITKFNNDVITSMNQLSEKIKASKPSEKVEITIIRNGNSKITIPLIIKSKQS